MDPRYEDLTHQQQARDSYDDDWDELEPEVQS